MMQPFHSLRLCLATGLGLALVACSDDDRTDECLPGAAERCGGGDEDCDGLIDEPGAEGCRIFQQDNDGDGQADGDAERCLCAATPPWTLDTGVSACGDCDDDNPCTDDRCDADTASCVNEPREGTCDDRDPCTVDTICLNGMCQGGSELDCDDGNPCTGDLCNAGLGCSHAALLTTCDDGDRCTGPDRCTDGRCTGAPLPSCGEPYCGDGRCDDDESCESCEPDCSPLGFGRCGAACDPLGAGCGPDAVCVPTQQGTLAGDILFAGNGACGQTCERNSDCASGACLRTDGLTGGGVCRPACDLDAPACDPGETCLATGSPGIGACNRGGACTIDDPEACAQSIGTTCVARAAGSVDGVCLRTCYSQAPEGCGTTPCQAFADEAVHEGVCVSEPMPCDPTDGSGCPGGEACVLIGGRAFGGSAALCQPIGVERRAGDACLEDLASCAAGVLCWRGSCVQTCDPTAPSCARGGSCEAIGEAFGKDSAAVGVCRGSCGDGACRGEEDCLSCADDCGACPLECGDGRCVPGGESCESCSEDCGACPTCGDGPCEFGFEDCSSCPADCGTCRCGDRICSAGEDCLGCQADCGECTCGDGRCEGSESCRSCQSDCGACPCGDGVCDAGESCSTCPGDCGACPCGDGRCDLGEDCGSCLADCPICVCGDGRCIASEDSETCPHDCPAGCGDGVCGKQEGCESCPDDCGACTCGDGACDAGESCGTCSTDCGECGCGDGTCQAGEDCVSCSADCGTCECGDGTCDATESCFACEKDCGECPRWCGDGICAHPEETCYNCPGDCTMCTDVCGDAICGPSESCLTCPTDCQGFMGLGGCGATCDFLQQDCPANSLCMPADEQGLNAKIYDVGDGICGASCVADGDCGAGRCVGIDGAATSRVCMPSVIACNPIDGDGCDALSYCMPRSDNPAQGVCVAGCRRDYESACGGRPEQCHRGTWRWWRPGICVGQEQVCDPALQTGCPADETCTLLGPPPGMPFLPVCSTRVGPIELGQACDAGDNLCAAGLLCDSGTCRRPCKPGTVGRCSAGEACVDIGNDDELGLGAGVLGVCR